MAGFDLTILTKKVEGLKQAFDSGQFADALSGSLKTGRQLMNIRIFRDTKDVEGQLFGEYIGKKSKLRNLKAAIAGTTSRTTRKRIRQFAGVELTQWQRKRTLLGKQIAKKDLFYTGGLAASIEVQIENEKAAVIQFNTDEMAKIAKGQAQQITNIRDERKANASGGEPFKIFTFNDDERNQVVRQGKELIIQILKPK